LLEGSSDLFIVCLLISAYHYYKGSRLNSIVASLTCTRIGVINSSILLHFPSDWLNHGLLASWHILGDDLRVVNGFLFVKRVMYQRKWDTFWGASPVKQARLLRFSQGERYPHTATTTASSGLLGSRKRRAITVGIG
jgi:hypothetical protein